MSIFNKIHKYLEKEISEVNNIIISNLKAKEELIQRIAEHLINSGGKRIRPIVTILCIKMFKVDIKEGLKLATAIEFIHAATLLHDDVVDESLMRRFKPTANFIWGNKTSILVGDFLLSQAFKLMISVGLISTLECVSRATSILIEGEVVQLKMLDERKIITTAEYDELITAKTAELFGAACKIGGIVANQPDAICNILQNFGIVLGKIFQITDDLLDYVGNSELIGKNIGDDFFEGKVTLPIIFLYNKLPLDGKTKIKEIFQLDKRTMIEFKNIQHLLRDFKIEKEIISYLSILKLQASNLIDQIKAEDKTCKGYLSSLIDFSMNRVH